MYWTLKKLTSFTFTYVKIVNYQLNYAAKFSYCIFQKNWVSTTKYLLIFTEVDKLEELSE